MTPEAITVAVAIFGMCVAFVAGYLLAAEDADRRRKWFELTELEIEQASNYYTEYEGFMHGAIWAQEKLKELNT